MGMRDFWESLVAIFESIGRARAAAALTREGRYEEARKIFEDDNEVHP
jgi:hypothetical protein